MSTHRCQRCSLHFSQLCSQMPEVLPPTPQLCSQISKVLPPPPAPFTDIIGAPSTSSSCVHRCQRCSLQPLSSVHICQRCSLLLQLCSQMSEVLPSLLPALLTEVRGAPSTPSCVHRCQRYSTPQPSLSLCFPRPLEGEDGRCFCSFSCLWATVRDEYERKWK